MIFYRHFWFCSSLVFFAACSSLTPLQARRSPAQIAQCELPVYNEELKFGKTQVSIRTLANPYRMEIVGTPFAVRSQVYTQYIFSRRTLGENPLGDRKYWNKKAPIQPAYDEDAFSLFPELFVEERFSATLSLEKPSESEWAKLGYILGNDAIINVLALPKIWKFAHVSAKCFGRAPFSTSIYGRFAKNHLDFLLKTTEDALLTDKQKELDAAIKARQVRPIEKLRYYAKPIGNNPLIVTHASDEFDPDQIAKPGIDLAVAQARKDGRRVAFLMQYDNAEDITQQYQPIGNDLVMYSGEGEHSFTSGNNQATVVGSYFGLCHGLSIQDIFTRYFVGKTEGQFTVTIPLAASRTHQQDSMPVVQYAPITMKTYLEKVGPSGFQKIVEKYFLKPTHFGANEYFEYSDGPNFKLVSNDKHRVSYFNYTFTALLDGKEFLKRGTGPRHVRLEFTTH